MVLRIATPTLAPSMTGVVALMSPISPGPSALFRHYRLQDDSFDREQRRRIVDRSWSSEYEEYEGLHRRVEFARKYLNPTQDLLGRAFRELDAKLEKQRCWIEQASRFSPQPADEDKVKRCIFGLQQSVYTRGDAQMKLNREERAHVEYAVTATFKERYGLDSHKGRERLELFWNGLNLGERAFLLYGIRHYLRDHLSPGKAFFLFQLIGRASPLEIGVAQYYRRADERTEFQIIVGKTDRAHGGTVDSHNVGHTHPLNFLSTGLGDVMPSMPDLCNNRRCMDPNDLLCSVTAREPEEVVKRILLGPFGGSIYLTTKEKIGLWGWRRERVVHRIMWAARPGSRPTRNGLLKLMRHKQSLSERLDGDKIITSRISWNELIESIAESFTYPL